MRKQHSDGFLSPDYLSVSMADVTFQWFLYRLDNTSGFSWQATSVVLKATQWFSVNRQHQWFLLAKPTPVVCLC
jgi:hypothetical protein